MIIIQGLGCVLEEKIEGSPVLWTCKIQAIWHMIFMGKSYISSSAKTKSKVPEKTGIY